MCEIGYALNVDAVDINSACVGEISGFLSIYFFLIIWVFFVCHLKNQFDFYFIFVTAWSPIVTRERL